MSSFEEKKTELERVLGVFQNYIEGSELLDVVYSKKFGYCLLYTSDAADDMQCVDLGGRRIIKKNFFSSRRRHTRLAAVSWARRCV